MKEVTRDGIGYREYGVWMMGGEKEKRGKVAECLQIGKGGVTVGK